MANFTPGPWTTKRSPALHDGAYDYAINADGALVLSEAFGRSALGGLLPAEANARLIASAPDLLEALKHAVHWHDQLSPADIANFEAVISKAEGRS